MVGSKCETEWISAFNLIQSTHNKSSLNERKCHLGLWISISSWRLGPMAGSIYKQVVQSWNWLCIPLEAIVAASKEVSLHLTSNC